MRVVCGLTRTRPYRCFDCDFLFLAPKRTSTTSEERPRVRAAHG